MPLALSVGPASVVFTGRDEGDFGRCAGGSELRERQRAVVDLPWRTVRQVHGTRAVTIDTTAPVDELEADGLVTALPEVALAVKTADCAPVALASGDGIIGMAHAGWRGLTGGILSETVEAMRALGATEIAAAVGPCIGPECYEFSDDALAVLASRLGAGVRSYTATGQPALDLPAAVRQTLGALGVRVVFEAAACTACDAHGRWFSHRARRQPQRQAAVVWRP